VPEVVRLHFPAREYRNSGGFGACRHNETTPLRFVVLDAICHAVARERRPCGELVMVKYKAAIIGACAAIALAAAPVTPASAHGYHHGGLIFGLAALGAAAVVGAATIVTAPVRVLAAPFYAPGAAYYAPAPAYYAPPPAYYAPPPSAYYPPPPGYYGR
jgi:hypothetical protein